MLPFTSAAKGQLLQPERRSGIRIITLKNAGWLALSLTVIFLLFSAYMERRSRGESGYGRLFDRRIDAPRAATPPPQPEVITESPERPVRRHDVLRDPNAEQTPEQTSAAQTGTAAPPPSGKPVRVRRSGGRITISGGSAGVTADVPPAQPTTTAPPPR